MADGLRRVQVAAEVAAFEGEVGGDEEILAPIRHAASWDNVGLLVGDPESTLHRVLLAIDCTLAVLEEARTGEVEAIIAYHPVLFAPTKRFVAGSLAYAAARAGISVYSPHTALDVALGGTNDVLCDMLGVVARRPLTFAQGSSDFGFGRVGEVEVSTVDACVARLKRALGVPRVLVTGEGTRRVRRVGSLRGKRRGLRRRRGVFGGQSIH